MSATDRVTTRTVVRARYPDGPWRDHFVVETLSPTDDADARLAYWQSVNARENAWADLHLATEYTTVTYTRHVPFEEREAEHAAQWADVEAGEAHLRDTDPERNPS